MGASRDATVTAVRQSEEKVVERTVLVKPDKTAGQKMLDQTIGAENFASLSKGSLEISPPQLKDGFVGYGQPMRAPASFVRGRTAIFGPLSVSGCSGGKKQLRIQGKEADRKC